MVIEIEDAWLELRDVNSKDDNLGKLTKDQLSKFPSVEHILKVGTMAYLQMEKKGARIGTWDYSCRIGLDDAIKLIESHCFSKTEVDSRHISYSAYAEYENYCYTITLFVVSKNN